MVSVTTQVHDRILRLHLSDSEARNAIGFSMVAKLQEELAKISKLCEQNPIACVIIEAHALQGKSQKTWLSGGNLKDLYDYRQKSDAIIDFFESVNACLHTLENLPVPVIMQQNGWALGGGAEFVLAGDLRFATKDSGLDFKQLKIGLPTGFGGTRRLINLIGLSHSQQILLTSATLDAKDAQKLGILHRVFGSEKKLAKHVESTAQYLCTLSSESLRAQKTMLCIHKKENKLELELFKAQLNNKNFTDFLADFSQSRET